LSTIAFGQQQGIQLINNNGNHREASPVILDDRSRPGTCILTINRPDKRDAFTPQMYRELAQRLRLADHDRAICAVVLTGAQGVFSSGNDLHHFLENPAVTRR
jgi:enoyl-CoA hydratase/carnithine racemase